MVTYLTGRQNTGTVLSYERKVDIPPEIFWLSTDLAPLLHISMGGGANGKLPVKKREAINPEFAVLE